MMYSRGMGKIRPERISKKVASPTVMKLRKGGKAKVRMATGGQPPVATAKPQVKPQAKPIPSYAMNNLKQAAQYGFQGLGGSAAAKAYMDAISKSMPSQEQLNAELAKANQIWDYQTGTNFQWKDSHQKPTMDSIMASHLPVLPPHKDFSAVQNMQMAYLPPGRAKGGKIKAQKPKKVKKFVEGGSSTGDEDYTRYNSRIMKALIKRYGSEAMAQQVMRDTDGGELLRIMQEEEAKK